MMKFETLRPRRAAAFAAALLLSACSQPSQTQSGEIPVVEVITAQAQPLTLSSELPGRIEPVRVAEVRARVPGIVLRRKFTEGADVEAGQVLFEIDPAPFKAALSRAEATLFEARATVRRYEPLVRMEAISQQDFEAAQAAMKIAQANVETARLELEYATVRAPISGRIGRALVTEGALVGQGEVTPLAMIQQLDPVYADFKQPVADVLRLRAALDEGKLAQDADQGVPISVKVEGINQTREGRLLFSDITVDRSTGQVSLRGEIANPDGLLLPGMYVRVRTEQGVDPKAILVPQRAVQRGSDGKAHVLVVGEDDTVVRNEVQTGAMYGANWHIATGLEPGDRVIVGGAAQPGTKVRIATPVAAEAEQQPSPASAARS